MNPSDPNPQNTPHTARERLPAWVPTASQQGTFASKELIAVPPPTTSTHSPPPIRKKPPSSPDSLAAGILAGDRSALAQAITLIESNSPAHRPAARKILSSIIHKTGSSLRIGISGVPGAGKSTFIEAFGNLLCDHHHKVAVLAVDPSSKISGGSILGDKTRMESLSRRPESFIRPSPSSGILGGVTRKTRESIHLCEAAGFDTVLVETVGVGQSETEVRSMVDCFLLIMLAGTGDELQGMKKGILEFADVIAINKADGNNLPRALAARAELERVVAFLNHPTPGWKPPVLAISALTRQGLDHLLTTIQSHQKHLHTYHLFQKQRQAQALLWWESLVKNELHSRLLQIPKLAELSQSLESDILAGKIPPSLAAEIFLDSITSQIQPAQ